MYRPLVFLLSTLGSIRIEGLVRIRLIRFGIYLVINSNNHCPVILRGCQLHKHVLCNTIICFFIFFLLKQYSFAMVYDRWSECNTCTNIFFYQSLLLKQYSFAIEILIRILGLSVTVGLIVLGLILLNKFNVVLGE